MYIYTLFLVLGANKRRRKGGEEAAAAAWKRWSCYNCVVAHF
jgi:hypothetical protein